MGMGKQVRDDKDISYVLKIGEMFVVKANKRELELTHSEARAMRFSEEKEEAFRDTEYPIEKQIFDVINHISSLGIEGVKVIKVTDVYERYIKVVTVNKWQTGTLTFRDLNSEVE